jgi:hypothetical protein
MSRLRSWLGTQARSKYVPLFATDSNLVVETDVRRYGKRLLRRSEEMERTIVELVADGV